MVDSVVVGESLSGRFEGKEVAWGGVLGYRFLFFFRKGISFRKRDERMLKTYLGVNVCFRLE